jgi:16S rRNA (cytidine1402-2'-O)-methyltransferase
VSGTLYLVSTPIGDPDDLSPRAARCLAEVDIVAAEDTRVARTLLGRLGLRKKLVSYHDHNEQARTPALLEELEAGRSVALVADKGTPLINDPGYRLVRAAAEAGVRVVPVPGPSATLAALVASGLPADRFTVVGFLPRRSGRRRAALAELESLSGALIFFEAPHRIGAMLSDLAEVLGNREAALARDLTKKDEDIRRGKLAALAAAFSGDERIYGEFTVVVAGREGNRPPIAQDVLDRALARLLAEGVSPRAIRDIVADLTGLPRSDVYARALELMRDAE